jgi:hypothetical protein
MTMMSPAARLGIYLLLSFVAAAAVAGGVALSRRGDAKRDAEHAAWGASAG